MEEIHLDDKAMTLTPTSPGSRDIETNRKIRGMCSPQAGQTAGTEVASDFKFRRNTYLVQ